MTGERLDTQAILQEVFRPRELSASESVMEYARQRQGVVVAISIIVAFLILAGIHQFVMRRNATAVTDTPAVPLSELTDITKPADDTTPVPMPDLDFPYDGRAQAMRTFVLERGAIAPAAPGAAPGAVPASGRPSEGRPEAGTARPQQ